jgi:hypothetical protein
MKNLNTDIAGNLPLFSIRLLSVAVAASVSGCTWALQHSTLSVSSSIAPIIEQQVLANLSAAYEAPYSIPAQAVLSQGAVQIQNGTSVALKLPYTRTASSSKEGDPGVTFQWQETWTIVPVMDAQDIARLQYLYTGAVLKLTRKGSKPEPQAAAGRYLSFSALRSSYGQATAATCTGAPTDAKTVSPEAAIPGAPLTPEASAKADPFQDCVKIDKLLADATNWLLFDNAPGTASNDPDAFIPKGKFGNHKIWVKPKEFAEFTMFILDAVPNTQSTASNGKGLSLSLQ